MLNKFYRLFIPAKQPGEIMEKYNIPRTINLEIEFTADGYLVATSPDLPGLITQGKNGEELLKMLNDAILTYFDVPKRESDIIMDKLNIEGHGVVRHTKEELQVA